MTTEVSTANVSPSAKTYSECAVQTDVPSPRVNSIPLLSPRRLDMSFDDPANASVLFSDLGSPSSGAYTQSSPRPASVQPHRLAKPRLEPGRPTSLITDSNRIVSMPETAPVFQVKRELNHSVRVVSMPSQPAKPATDALADLSMSSEGASGNSSSLYTATSLASISESDTSDSVIIIEHNGGLAEGFLRQATIKEEVEGQEKMSVDDQGWITWTRSPPRPIPALHGPLSLPYARCPSGAEGTIIDEPENLPRMIWGLDPETQSTKFEEQATSPQPLSSASSLASPALGPAMFKQAVSAPVKISAPPPVPSSPVVRKTVHPVRNVDKHLPAGPPPGIQAAPQTRQGFASMGNISHPESSGFKRVPPQTFHQQPALDNGYPLQEAHDIHRQSRAQNQKQSDSYSSMPRTVKAHDFPLSTTVGAMKVSARPAPGSALPQIVIEPRSPENFVANSRPTAIELAQQYQRQLEQQALRNIKPSSYLPTPPSTSSPLWSSNFSPYPESMPSPSLSEAQALAQAIHHHQTQLRALEQSEQLRRLVHERLEDLNSHSVLEPAAQINSLHGGRQSAQPDYNQLSSPQDLLAFLARNEQQQAANVLAHAPAMVPAPKMRTLSGQSASSMTSAASRERHLSSSSQMSTAGYGLASPTSPDIQTTARGYQPRSIPLARLIQRRLSSVPEESDSSATIRGRSSSPPPAIHGLGLESDKRQWTRRNDGAPGGRILAYDYVDRAPRAGIERAPRGPDERSLRGFDGGRTSRGQTGERSSIGFDSSERQQRAAPLSDDSERAKVRLPAPREIIPESKSKPIRAPLGPRVGTPSVARTQPMSSGGGRSQTASSTRSRIVDDRETENDHGAARRRTTREGSRGSGSSSREGASRGSQRKLVSSVAGGRG